MSYLGITIKSQEHNMYCLDKIKQDILEKTGRCNLNRHFMQRTYEVYHVELSVNDNRLRKFNVIYPSGAIHAY